MVLVLDTGNFGVADVWSVLTKAQPFSVWSVYSCGPGPAAAQRRTRLEIMPGVAVKIPSSSPPSPSISNQRFPLAPQPHTNRKPLIPLLPCPPPGENPTISSASLLHRSNSLIDPNSLHHPALQSPGMGESEAARYPYAAACFATNGSYETHGELLGEVLCLDWLFSGEGRVGPQEGVGRPWRKRLERVVFC